MNDQSSYWIKVPVVLGVLALAYWLSRKSKARQSATGKDPAATPSLTAIQKKHIAQEFERHADGKGSEVNAAIAMLRMDMPEALPGFAAALEKSSVHLLFNASGDPLILKLSPEESHLAIFTEAGFTQKIAAKFSSHQQVVALPMREVCARVAGDVGLCINPEHETFRFTMPPKMFAAFRKCCLKDSGRSLATVEKNAEVPKHAPMRTGQGNPGVFDGPKNPLEEAIVAVRSRTITTSEFIEILLNSDVFVVTTADQLKKDDETVRLLRNPKLFSMTYPEYSTLCIYSHGTRAKPTSDLYPDFRYAVSVQFGDFFTAIQGDVGLTINPYWDINMEWTPAQVKEIRKMIQKTRE